MKYSLSKTRLYSIYSGMKQRCYNPNNQHYSIYGGKGIKICDEWLNKNGLQNFIEWSLNNGYEEHLTIDRINSSADYSPQNCRWITSSLNSARVHSSCFDIPSIAPATEGFRFKNNQQIVIEIKKLMLEKQISQRVIAEKLNIKPQGLTKLLAKKNFGFEDAQKVLSAMGCDLVLDFQDKPPEHDSND